MADKGESLLKKLPQMGRRNVKNIPALLAAGLITPEEADQLRKQEKERKAKAKK